MLNIFSMENSAERTGVAQESLIQVSKTSQNQDAALPIAKLWP